MSLLEDTLWQLLCLFVCWYCPVSDTVEHMHIAGAHSQAFTLMHTCLQTPQWTHAHKPYMNAHTCSQKSPTHTKTYTDILKHAQSIYYMHTLKHIIHLQMHTLIYTLTCSHIHIFMQLLYEFAHTLTHKQPTFSHKSHAFMQILIDWHSNVHIHTHMPKCV